METKETIAVVAILGTFVEAVGMLMLIEWASAIGAYVSAGLPAEYVMMFTGWSLPIAIVVLGWIVVGICTLIATFFIGHKEK